MHRRRPVAESLKEYGRGVAGGLLFSLPLLYTMEVWWTGFIIQPYQLLIYVATTFLLLLGYNRYAGMHEGATWQEVIIDSVEEIGIGLVLSLIVLWMLGRIDLSEMSTDEVMGKIIIETMPVAIGVSVGTAQLGGEVRNDTKRSKSRGRDGEKRPALSQLGHIVLSVCGAVLIAGNIAPTEEVPMIAIENSPLRILAVALASLLVGSIILFYSNFGGQASLAENGGLFTVLSGVCLTYIVALTCSAFMLWFFGRFEVLHFNLSLYQTVILGLPAMLGASAAKLLIK
jgi:putative integral membrane protein (TIGR02587 family)